MTLKSIVRQTQREGGAGNASPQEKVVSPSSVLLRKMTDPIELDLLSVEVEDEINRLRGRKKYIHRHIHKS